MFRLFLLFPLLPLIMTATATDYTNEAEFKVKFNAAVATPYSAAIEGYNFLLESLNNQLADFDPENIQSLIKPIDDASLSASQRFITNIKLASTNAIQIVNQIDVQMTGLGNQISQTKDQITNLNSGIEKTQVQIQGSQSQVSLATQALNQAQQNLATHEKALQEAHKRLDKAKNHCFGLRRRKRGLISKAWRKAKKGVNKVVKPIGKLGKGLRRGVCEVANVITRDIKRNKGDVDRARVDVNNAQAHLNQMNQQLANQQTQLHSHQSNLQGQQGQLTNLQHQLNYLKTKRDQINNVDQKMKSSVAFIESILAGGLVVKFNMDLGYLLNLQSVVTPLREIGEAIGTLSGENAANSHFLPRLSVPQVTALKEKIDIVIARLKNP